MSLPTSRFSYRDCYDAFDKAVADAKGIRIRMQDQDQALYYRLRLNQARKIDRQENAKTYEPGHPLYGCSAYDCIVIRILPEADQDDKLTGLWWLYLQKQEVIPGLVESLSEDNDDATTPMATESDPRSAPGPVPQSVDLGNWDEDPSDGGSERDAEDEGGAAESEEAGSEV